MIATTAVQPMADGSSESRPVVDTGAHSAAACLFRSLGDPTRLAILWRLSGRAHKVVDLTAALGLAQSTVSGHLACLRDCGLVSSQPQGRASLWSLSHEPEVAVVLAAAQRLLEATGDAAAGCATYGEDANR